MRKAGMIRQVTFTRHTLTHLLTHPPTHKAQHTFESIATLQHRGIFVVYYGWVCYWRCGCGMVGGRRLNQHSERGHGTANRDRLLGKEGR